MIALALNCHTFFCALPVTLWIASSRRERTFGLRNGPDKNDSNNGNEHVGMQKGANFSIVCTYFWLA